MMAKFTVIESSTGRVMFSGDASEPASLADVDQEVLFDVSLEGGYVLDGVHLLEGNKPSPNYTFNYTTKQWEDPRSLEQFKDAKWEQIKQARAMAISSPLSTPYGTFDADPKARQNITDAILMVQTLEAKGLPSGIDFTLADNEVVTLTASEMAEVGLTLGARVQAAHTQSRTLRTDIYSATTAEEVEAISWQS